MMDFQGGQPSLPFSLNVRHDLGMTLNVAASLNVEDELTAPPNLINDLMKLLNGRYMRGWGRTQVANSSVASPSRVLREGMETMLELYACLSRAAS